MERQRAGCCAMGLCHLVGDGGRGGGWRGCSGLPDWLLAGLRACKGAGRPQGAGIGERPVPWPRSRIPTGLVKQRRAHVDIADVYLLLQHEWLLPQHEWLLLQRERLLLRPERLLLQHE